MVVPQLRTQNGSTSLGEKSDEQETRAMLAAGQCRVVLIQRAVLRIQRIFHVELRPPETGGHCITTPPTDKIWTPVELWSPGLDSTLHYDPRSWFNVECWPRVMIHYLIMTRDRDHNSMWNCDPGSWFNVEFWPGVILPRWIVTPGHNFTLKCDPGSWFHVELLPGSRFLVESRSRVMIPRWKVTPGLDSTLKYDPRSEFHIELWPRVTIKRWIVTWAWDHNSMWISDPGS